MSSYEVAKFCRDCLMKLPVRELAAADPVAALVRYDLTDRERSLLLAGEVGLLEEEGANAFLLSYLVRWKIFGLDVPLYSARMRSARGSNAHDSSTEGLHT